MISISRILNNIKKKNAERTETNPAGTRKESLAVKIIKHRLRVFYRLALIITVSVALFFVITIQIKNRSFSTCDEITKVKLKNSSYSTVKDFNGNILLYNSDGASCMDKKGTAKWNQTFEMQTPMMSMCENNVAFGDYNGRTIYMMNTEGTVGEIDTKMPIRSFTISANGVVAAVLDDASVTWIYLFDSSGNTIAYFKTTMEKSGYPISVSISPNGYLVAVSYLFADNGSMKSTVAFYNFGPVGQNEIDNFVSSYDYKDAVVPLVHFMTDQNAFAVADNRLVVYQGNQKPVSVADVLIEDEIQGVFYGENNIALVFRDSSKDAKYRIDIYDKNGKKADSKKINMDEYTDVIFDKKKMIVYGDKNLVVHNIGGIDNFNGKLNKGIQVLVPEEMAYHYTGVTADEVISLELK